MSERAPGIVRDGATLRVTGDVDADTVLALRKQGEQEIQ